MIAPTGDLPLLYRCRVCPFQDTRVAKAEAHRAIRGVTHTCDPVPDDERLLALVGGEHQLPLTCVHCGEQLDGVLRGSYLHTDLIPGAPYLCSLCGGFNVVGEDRQLHAPEAADIAEHGAMMRELRRAVVKQRRRAARRRN